MIDELRQEQGLPVAPMCRVLGVSKSGYYAWRTRKPSARRTEDERFKVAIKAAHERGRGTYGPEKIQEDLADVEKIEVGINRIKRLRRELKIRCKQRKKYKATTNSKHSMPVAPNLLDQNFWVSGPNQVWVADITYVATDEGWLYLAGIKDLWNREIVGYAMSHRMTQELVGRALFRSVAARRPPVGLIHHSDRGSQYCSRSYRKLLRQFNMVASMSRKGNCYDNAPMESFFGTLKTELVHHRKYRTRQEAIADISEYIEVFYNRQRRHASLGNISPAAYWKKCIRQQGAA
jgi:putative transposase